MMRILSTIGPPFREILIDLRAPVNGWTAFVHLLSRFF
jgi:hypothetical protein